MPLGYKDLCPYHRFDITWEALPDLLPDAERWIEQNGKRSRFITNVQTVEVKLGYVWVDGQAGVLKVFSHSAP